MTPVEETLRTLDDLVRAGKIRYIGCSNFSGWHLMKSLAVSEKYGLARYVAHQAYYSLVGREYEWELMPLALDQKVGAVVWSPLGWGRLTGKIRRGQPLPEASRLHETAARRGRRCPTSISTRSSTRSTRSPHETGKTVPQIALNWLLQRPTVANVIIGARNEEQLRQNLGAVGWNLTPEQVAGARRRQRRRRDLSLLAPARLRRAQPAAGAGLGEAGALQPHHCFVERREEARAVAGGEGLGAAGDLAHGAQVLHQVAGGQRHADGGFGEGLAAGADDLGARLHAAAGQRDVRGDDDSARRRPLGDPVIRRVKAAVDDDALDHRRLRHQHEAVGHHPDLQAIAAGDTVDLVLHRAGIGIDVIWIGPGMGSVGISRKQRRAALTDGPSIVEPRSGAAGRKNAGQAAEPSVEARIQVTSRDDRGQRQ